MADEKVIKILMSLGFTKDGIAKTMSEFKQVQGQMQALEDESKRLRKEMDEAIKQDKNTDELVQNLALVEKGLEKVRIKAKQTFNDGFGGGSQAAAFNLRDIGEKLNQLGSRASGAGFGILGPIQAAANSYLDAVNSADPIANRWRDAMADVEDSWLKIGRVAADELLPVIETVAKLTSDLSDFVEANPELLKIAVGAGTGLVAAGGALQAAGNIATVVGTAQGIGKIKGMEGAGAAAAKLGQISIAATAVYLTGNLATDVANNINEERGIGGGWTMGDALKSLSPITQFLTAGVLGTDALGWKEASAGFYKTGMEWSNFMDKVLGFIPGLETNRLRTLPDGKGVNSNENPYGSDIVSNEELKIFNQWEMAVKELKDFEEQSGSERSLIVEEQAAERTRIEQEYGAQRSQTIIDFLRSETRIAEDYYRSRSQVAKQYGKDVERMEEDHQREMKRMLEEHNSRVRDLTATRDALGLKKENRSYALQRENAEDDYRVQARRRSEDFADQLEQMESNYELQRSRREEDFALRLSEMDARHKTEMDKRKEQDDEVLKKLDERNGRELKQLTENETQRQTVLNDIAVTGLAALGKSAEEEMKNMLTRFNNYKLSLTGNTPGPGAGGQGGRAAGGYVNSYGLYHMAEQGREFVLNNSTTRAAENLMGRQLTQQDIIAGMSGKNSVAERLAGRMISDRNNSGSGRGANVTYNFNLPNGSISESKRLIAENVDSLRQEIWRDFGNIVGANS